MAPHVLAAGARKTRVCSPTHPGSYRRGSHGSSTIRIRLHVFRRRRRQAGPSRSFHGVEARIIFSRLRFCVCVFARRSEGRGWDPAGDTPRRRHLHASGGPFRAPRRPGIRRGFAPLAYPSRSTTPSAPAPSSFPVLAHGHEQSSGFAAKAEGDVHGWDRAARAHEAAINLHPSRRTGNAIDWHDSAAYSSVVNDSDVRNRQPGSPASRETGHACDGGLFCEAATALPCAQPCQEGEGEDAREMK